MQFLRLKLNFFKQNIYESIDSEDVLNRQKFALFRIFSFTGSVVSAGVFVKMCFMFHHLHPLHYVLPALSLVMLFNFYSIKSSEQLQRAYVIVLASAFVILHIVSYSTGGIRSASILYHPVVILYAFMLLGKKGGRAFSILFAFQVAFIFIMSRFTNYTSFEFLQNNQSHIEEDFLFNGFFTFFLISAHSHYLNSGRNIVIQKITQQRDELAKKNLMLKQSNITLETANSELDKFAYIVSHDLKAPLRAIGSVTGMIQDDARGKISPEVDDHLNIIHGRVARMEALINGILQYSKSVRSKEVFSLTNMGQLINESVELLDASAFCKVDKKIDNLSYHVSRTKMQQVFINLIGNAIKHNNKAVPDIIISVKHAADFLHFIVKDNGPGIHAKFHEKIFVIFQTLKARDEFESTGIGLSIVKRIIDDMGGKIWVESEEGSGAEFHFLWPVKAPLYENIEMELAVS